MTLNPAAALQAYTSTGVAPMGNESYDSYMSRVGAAQYAGNEIDTEDSNFKQLMAEAANGDKAAQDRLWNYILTEKSNDRAREWTASREDTQYQRLIADIKAAGINPYSLLQNGASPVSSSSSGSSYGGSPSSANARHDQDITMKIVGAILGAVIPVFGAIIAGAGMSSK